MRWYIILIIIFCLGGISEVEDEMMDLFFEASILLSEFFI